MLKINLLGQFELCLDGDPIEVSSRPARTLLVYLILTRGMKHPREKLAGLLWPESSEQNARKNLRQALWRLRKAIGDQYLLIDPQNLAFDGGTEVWLDIDVLEHQDEVDGMPSASVYEGELLPGFYEDWVLLERDRMEALFDRRMRETIHAYVAAERWMDVLVWAERWIAHGRAPEPAYRALMQAHAALGEITQVDAIYRRCKESLQQDLGVDPSEETKQLHRTIMSGEITPRPRTSDAPQMSSATERKLLVLPAQSTQFIGRDDELKNIRQLLDRHPFISITGPGGIGKTRLAVQSATISESSFKHGCFFVPLAPIRDADHIIQTIAETLNFPIATHQDPEHQLLRYLKDRQLLLILDNFEHLLDGMEIVNHILEAAPEVKILVTSREKLNLQSETNYILRGMDFPSPSGIESGDRNEAISLFVQAAGKVRPGYSPETEDIQHISKICQIVGGMPLAIELAAAWLHVLDVVEVAQELEKGFDLLETERRDTPERHRNIQTIFNQSWDLLNASEKDVFINLSVFRGGFTRDAAQQVAGATLQQLAGLVNKSFLLHDPANGRFELHELLRQFGQMQLEQTPEAIPILMEEYSKYFAGFMEKSTGLLRGNSQTAALNDIVADIENVRTAWRYLLSPPRPDMLLKGIAGLWHVYWIRWWTYAGMELFKEAVERIGDTDDEHYVVLRGLAMAFQSYFMAWLGLSEKGYELARKSLQTLEGFDHPEAFVFAGYSLVVNAYMLGKMAEESIMIKKMVEIADGVGDRWLSAFVMFAEGMIALIEGRYAEAQAVGERALEIYEDIGDSSGSTLPLIVLGHRALVEGEYEQAKKHYQRCLTIAEGIGFHYSSQTSTKYLSKVSISTGDLEEAEDYLGKSLALTHEIGFVRDIVNLFFEYARLRLAQNRIKEAVRLLVFVIQHPENQQMRWMEGRLLDRATELLESIKSEYPVDLWQKAEKEGSSLELESTVRALLES
jgi:DNA-binding SARP family transcriptional activator